MFLDRWFANFQFPNQVWISFFKQNWKFQNVRDDLKLNKKYIYSETMSRKKKRSRFSRSQVLTTTTTPTTTKIQSGSIFLLDYKFYNSFELWRLVSSWFQLIIPSHHIPHLAFTDQLFLHTTIDFKRKSFETIEYLLTIKFVLGLSQVLTSGSRIWFRSATRTWAVLATSWASTTRNITDSDASSATKRKPSNRKKSSQRPTGCWTWPRRCSTQRWITPTRSWSRCSSRTSCRSATSPKTRRPTRARRTTTHTLTPVS